MTDPLREDKLPLFRVASCFPLSFRTSSHSRKKQVNRDREKNQKRKGKQTHQILNIRQSLLFGQVCRASPKKEKKKRKKKGAQKKKKRKKEKNVVGAPRGTLTWP